MRTLISLAVLWLFAPLSAQPIEGLYDGDQPQILPLWHRMADFSDRLRSVESCELSPDGRLAVSGGKFGYGVYLWRVADGQLLWKNYHESEVECVVFSPDGQRIASGGEDYFLRVWDVATGAQLFALDLETSGLDGVTWSPDGKYIVGGDEEGNVLFVDAVSYRVLNKIDCGATVNSLDFTRDGSRLVVGGNYQTAQSDGSTLYTGFAKFIDPLTREITGEVGEQDGSIKSVRWSADESMIATGGFDNKVRLFSAEDGRLLREFTDSFKIEAVAFSPDGQYLVTGGHATAIRFYRLKDGELALDWPSARVEYLDFSADGRLLLTGHEDSGLLSCYVFYSNTQARGNYQQLADEQLDNRDLKKQ